MNIDDKAWPLVVITMPSKATVASIDAMADYFQRCFARRERFALVTDTRPVSSILDAIWRKRLTDWINEPAFREVNARFNVGSSTILSSGPVRATLTALHWFWKPPSPQHYAADMPEAVTWCVEQLEAARVPIGEPLRALHASHARRASGVR